VRVFFDADDLELSPACAALLNKIKEESKSEDNRGQSEADVAKFREKFGKSTVSPVYQIYPILTIAYTIKAVFSSAMFYLAADYIVCGRVALSKEKQSKQKRMP
jgi:hypothetical protein